MPRRTFPDANRLLLYFLLAVAVVAALLSIGLTPNPLAPIAASPRSRPSRASAPDGRPVGRDPGHLIIGLALSLSAVEGQRERERLANVARVNGAKGIVWHGRWATRPPSPLASWASLCQ
jgi:hypothetical protein